MTPVARQRRVSYSTSSRGKFEWQSKWRFEFRVYPPWRLERSEQTVWNSSVSALQQMVTGMARFFKVTGVSSRFKLNSGPIFPPESRKKEIRFRGLRCFHFQNLKHLTMLLEICCERYTDRNNTKDVNFDRGHPVVLTIKLQVYIYIYFLISVRAQQYFWYI